MALDIINTYGAPNTTPVDSNYPYGSFKNQSSPGVLDGTPFEKAWPNDIQGLLQSLLKTSNITPNGNADTVQLSQYMQAIVQMSMGANFYQDDSTVANAFVVNPISPRIGPANLQDGMTIKFIASIATTSTTLTLDFNGFGAKAFEGINGIEAGDYVEVAYSSVRFGLDKFVFIGSKGATTQETLAQAISNKFVSPARIADLIATQSEVNAGSIDNKFITPLKNPIIGVNQTWQSVERSAGITYTNNTGRPIQVSITMSDIPGQPPDTASFYVDGLVVAKVTASDGTDGMSCQIIVPNGSDYKLVNDGGLSVSLWVELR